jgi:hypothetical protein
VAPKGKPLALLLRTPASPGVGGNYGILPVRLQRLKGLLASSCARSRPLEGCQPRGPEVSGRPPAGLSTCAASLASPQARWAAGVSGIVEATMVPPLQRPNELDQRLGHPLWPSVGTLGHIPFDVEVLSAERVV